MKQFIVLFVTFIVFLLFAFFANAIPNPAPIYCEEMGYTVEGNYCIFPDSKKCELWTFFNGECGQEYVKKLPCVKLGGFLLPGHECCEGLIPISKSEPCSGGICVEVVGAWSICAACGDGICANGDPMSGLDPAYGILENKRNCSLDCSDDVCKPEGYDWWTTPISKDFFCCEGLKKIGVTTYDPEIGLCGYSDWGLCSNCGNGNCEEWENYCNCPEDCPKEQSENQCDEGGIRNYTCSDGKEVSWCECLDNNWVCVNYPEIACSRTSSCPTGCVCKGGKLLCATEENPVNTEIISGEKKQPSLILIKKTSEDGLIIRSKEVEAVVFGKVSVMESKLVMETLEGNKEINILPEEASLKARETTKIIKVNEIELKEESQKPIYSVKGIKKAKLFFLFSVEVKIETKINAETGSVISIKKPWWSFLAW